jgi:hypothetical protein
MYQIDSSGSVLTQPAPAAVGTPGWFTAGNPATGTPATILDGDWFNAVQAELLNVLAAATITPTKGTNNQLLAAVVSLLAAKTNAKAGHVKTGGAPTSGTPTTYTNTLSFTAPSNGVVYAIQSVNIGSGGIQPGSQTNTIAISGSTSGSASDSDSTVTPMSNHIVKSVVAGETVTITGTLVSNGVAGTWLNESVAMSYTFTPSN